MSKFLFVALKLELSLDTLFQNRTLCMLTFFTEPLNTCPPAAGNPSDENNAAFLSQPFNLFYVPTLPAMMTPPPQPETLLTLPPQPEALLTPPPQPQALPTWTGCNITYAPSQRKCLTCYKWKGGKRSLLGKSRRTKNSKVARRMTKNTAHAAPAPVT